MTEFLLLAFLGALTQELLHWYDLRKKLDHVRVRNLLASKGYWIITALMIIISALCCWVLFYTAEYTRQLPFFSGAAFPLIFKKTISAFGENNQTNLGDGSSFKDYFQLYSL